MGAPSIAAQVVALTHLSVAELRQKWQEVFGEPTSQRHRQYLVKRLAWEIQRRDNGEELSPEAKARLDELQQEFRDTEPSSWFRGSRRNRPATETAPVRRKLVRNTSAPKPGTILTRIYRGQTIVVTVVEGGFQYDGDVFRSLSAVATAISGSHCSGPAFFGLAKKRDP